MALAPLTRTDSAEIGEVIEERAVRGAAAERPQLRDPRLPRPRRHARPVRREPLGRLAPSTPAARRTSTRSGSQANANAWLIDGIDNNEYTFNTVIVMPSVESVREFKVLTGTFSAEFGRGAGVVSVSTKSGNNEYHGTAFEYLRNDTFDARNFFARVPDGCPKPPLDRHQYGAQLSGPIIKNRTFFMVDFAGLNEKRGITTVNTVPTAATRVGDFSDYRDRSGNLIPIYDPLTTRPNPARDRRSCATPSRATSSRPTGSTRSASNVASIYPLPNGPGNFDNYTSTTNRDVNDNGVHGARRPHGRASATASSSATATTSTSSTRRRARRRAACPPRRGGAAASTSGRTSPASRTPA